MATQSSKLLDHARASEGETSQKLAEVRTARDAALLKSDDTAAILKLDDEIAQLERIAKAKADRVKILEREAEREEIEQRAKRKDQLIGRIDGEFKNGIENVDELAKAMLTVLKLYRRQIEIGGKIAAAWRWNNSDVIALRLNGLGIKELMCHELYRISFVAGMEAGPNSVSFPGALCSRLEWRLTPDKIKPMTETIRDLAEYGSRTMRGLKKEKPAPIMERAS